MLQVFLYKHDYDLKSNRFELKLKCLISNNKLKVHTLKFKECFNQINNNYNH